MVIKLKKIREEKCLSVEELALISGVDKKIIEEIEMNKADFVAVKDMRKIASGLGVRVTDIFFND